MKNIAIALLLSLVPTCAWPLNLSDLYKMDAPSRTWYLGGIYDANVIELNGDGQRSKCLESMGLPGFAKKMSEFVVALPVDANSKERRAYDQMNVALVAVLVIDKECKKN